MDLLALAQPGARDESIKCAQLEGQTWQGVTLVRSTESNHKGDGGRARAPPLSEAGNLLCPKLNLKHNFSASS